MHYSISPTNVRVLILFVVILVTDTKSYDEDMRMTAKEKETLDKFKQFVIPQIPETSIVHNYINDDLYFIRWLRASSFDIRTAEMRLLNHLKWRKEQNIDTINDEDWSFFETEYPLFTDTHDKEGRPTVEYWFAEMDVRKAILSGRGPRLARWLIKVTETNQRQLYEARAKGQKVSQAVGLADIGGFNIPQHGCPRCLGIYISLTLLYEAQYPGLYQSVHVVNVIPVFDIVLRALLPLLSPENREQLKTYTRKSQWEPVLDARYDKSQRSPRFGGTKARDDL